MLLRMCGDSGGGNGGREVLGESFRAGVAGAEQSPERGIIHAVPLERSHDRNHMRGVRTSLSAKSGPRRLGKTMDHGCVANKSIPAGLEGCELTLAPSAGGF